MGVWLKPRVWRKRHGLGRQELRSVRARLQRQAERLTTGWAEAPIKIVWPKSIRALLHGDKTDFTMLGLGPSRLAAPLPLTHPTKCAGDIVIPGVFVASALRFDHYLALLSSPPSPSSPPKKRRKLDRYPRPYFSACLAAYVAGLATTILVMHCFQAAQPALLSVHSFLLPARFALTRTVRYLSPACTASVLGLAAVKGDWSRMWDWDDGDDPFAEREQERKDEPEQFTANGQQAEKE